MTVRHFAMQKNTAVPLSIPIPKTDATWTLTVIQPKRSIKTIITAQRKLVSWYFVSYKFLLANIWTYTLPLKYAASSIVHYAYWQIKTLKPLNIGKVDCVTISSDEHKPCVFPFVWKGENQYECVKSGSKRWCATELKDNGEYEKWGHCGDSCPFPGWCISIINQGENIK